MGNVLFESWGFLVFSFLVFNVLKYLKSTFSSNFSLYVNVTVLVCKLYMPGLFFGYFLEAKNPCFVTKNYSKSSYISVFILSKKQHNWFSKIFITQEWLVVEGCPTPRCITFLTLYQLVYNILSYFNELILA